MTLPVARPPWRRAGDAVRAGTAHRHRQERPAASTLCAVESRISRHGRRATATGASGAGPVAVTQRILTLDVLRGIGLMGILIAHAPLFLQPVQYEVLAAPELAGLDRVTETLIGMLFEGKFVTLFSFLFGIGVALQMRRAQEAQRPFAPFFVRRMLVLLAIGVVHVVAFWWGDILIYYALLALWLVPLRRAPPRRLLRLALIAVLAPVVLSAGLVATERIAASIPDGAAQLERTYQATLSSAETGAAEAVRVYGGDDVAAMVRQRIGDWAFATFGLLLEGMLFVVLASFLLGLYVGRSGLLAGVESDHRRIVQRVRTWGFVVGAIGTVTWWAARPDTRLEPGGVEELLSTAGYVVGTPALALAYAATVTLALREPWWRRRLRPMEALGRTALSSYLLQSAIMTSLAYGYGGDLYARVGSTESRLIALAIVTVQVPLAIAWTRRYRYGPIEWLWRSLSYGKRQPWRTAEESW